MIINHDGLLNNVIYDVHECTIEHHLRVTQKSGDKAVESIYLIFCETVLLSVSEITFIT